MVVKKFWKDRYRGTTIWPFIFISDMDLVNDKVFINHETIHWYQQLELGILPGWILYLFYYIKGRVQGLNHDEAYRNNPFEKEAYQNEDNLDYLVTRNKYAWTKYL